MSAKAKSKLTPEQQKATMTRVLQKIKPYGFFVVCSLIVAAVSVAAQLYIPILCGSAIDMMLGKGAVDFAGVLRIIYEIIVVAVVAAFAQWLLSVCNNRITFAVSRDLRNAAMRKIQTLPLSYLDSHPSGDIVSRMVADVDTFADGLLMGFTQLFSGVLTILGTLLFMLSENVPITLVVVCITPLSLVVAGFLAKRSYGYFQSQSTVRGKQTALVNEMIEGQKVVQAFGHEAESLAAFDEVNGQLQDVSLKAIFFSSLTNPATRFVNNIVYAGVGLVGALYAVRGGITIGQLSVFLSYANQYTKPFNEISGVVTELQNALACAARVFELLDAEDQVPETENAAALQPDGHVQLEDVSFRYLPDRPLIEGLSLDVKPGQRIAIAAISDKLRNRFYPALKERYGIGRFAESYALTFLYAASSGASHSAQYALAAMFKAAADGKLDFVGHTREYAHRAHRVKELFERHGFHIVYDKDQDEHVSDGFFFTVGYGSMPSSDLVAALLRYGICAISLTSTGSLQNGVRVCVSQMNREEQYDLLDRRLRDFAQDYARK